MNPDTGGFAAAGPAKRRARLPGRPAGLKGRYRDRYATGPRPALDPRSLCGPCTASGTGRRSSPCPPNRAALNSTYQDQIPTNKSLRFQGIARSE
jgi:hypothetical protein